MDINYRTLLRNKSLYLTYTWLYRSNHKFIRLTNYDVLPSLNVLRHFVKCLKRNAFRNGLSCNKDHNCGLVLNGKVQLNEKRNSEVLSFLLNQKLKKEILLLTVVSGNDVIKFRNFNLSIVNSRIVCAFIVPFVIMLRQRAVFLFFGKIIVTLRLSFLATAWWRSGGKWRHLREWKNNVCAAEQCVCVWDIQQCHTDIARVNIETHTALLSF